MNDATAVTEPVLVAESQPVFPWLDALTEEMRCTTVAVDVGSWEVEASLWGLDGFRECSHLEKLIYLYLCSGIQRHMLPGILQLHPAMLASALGGGCTPEDVTNALRHLASKGLIGLDETYWLIVAPWITRQLAHHGLFNDQYALGMIRDAKKKLSARGSVLIQVYADLLEDTIEHISFSPKVKGRKRGKPGRKLSATERSKSEEELDRWEARKKVLREELYPLLRK
jgi:hypothetical protein